MENASKALLIVCGVFIVLIIVAITINIFQNSRNLGEIYNNNITDLRIKEHNSAFDDFEGEITGVQVIQLITNVSSNNSNNPDMKIEVLINNEKLMEDFNGRTDEIINNIDKDSIFEAHVQYNNIGYISFIEVRRPVSIIRDADFANEMEFYSR